MAKTAKAKTTKANPGKSLEDILFDCRNVLRGKVDSSVNRDAVMGLVFLKFAGDKYAARRTELEKEYSDVPPAVWDKPSFYISQNVFYLREHCRWTRRDAISDKALKEFRTNYGDKNIKKEDIFYYIYGVLNSPEYAERFDVDTKKTLARVPFAADFKAFAEAGRKLAALHVGYEEVDPWPVHIIGNAEGDNLRVEKMKIVDGSDGWKAVRYNAAVTIEGIPAEAWEYIVNGKSALDWIIERYADVTYKDSGLRNDANAWGEEHGNPRYILDLIARVVRVSVETVRIKKAMPELGIADEPEEE